MAAVSRWPDKKGGSHILNYADKAGGTTENAMFGTPDEVFGTLETLQKAGAEYIIFAVAGGREHMRRFARDIMPGFSRQRAAGGNTVQNAETLA